MNTETWRKIDGCLAEALEMPAELRRDFLISRLAGDPEAAFEARKLADCADDAERLFSRSPAAKYTGYSAGSHIGPWELMRPLGSGGMGVVWMARRADGQAAMLAAIKLLPAALLLRDSELRQRFLVEKQILARLDHPNIARLLDAGAGGGDTPNFVMEYVDGEPLLDFLTKHPLDRDAKLRLFLKICDAVQYAHGNLTIHRDLKPHNILVQSGGEPKLLDFGIGKILNESAGGGTITLHRAFSIDYASPEQIRGGHISTSTDIYSLGLILFETVTGERARRWNDKALGEVLDLSDRFSLPEHPAISRDLSAVMRKATAADPELRYRTVSEFAADLERVLDGRPVEARPAGVLYQAACFAKRNKFSVGASVAALFAIVSLGSWGWISAKQARHEQAIAQQQTRLLQEALHREESARESADQQRRQAEQQAELARKFGSLAESREQQAEDRLRSMLTIFERTLYSARNDVTKLAGGTQMGIRMIERTLEQLREVKPSAAGRPDYLALQADAHNSLADLYGGPNSNLGKVDLSKQHLEKSAELWREVNQLAPGRMGWERSYLNVRFVLFRRTVPFDPADPKSGWLDFERGYLAMLRRASQNESVLRDIANYYFWRARAGAKRNPNGQDFVRSLEFFQKTLNEDKPNRDALRNVALAHKYVAGVKESSEKLHHAREALRLDRMRVALEPTDANAKIDLAFSMVSVADAQGASGDKIAAHRGYLEGYRMRKELAQADPENVFLAGSLVYPMRYYGVLSITLKDWAALAEAVTEFSWVMHRQSPGKADPLIAVDLAYWKAIGAYEMGDRSAACSHFQEAKRLGEAVKPKVSTSAPAAEWRLKFCPPWNLNKS